MTSVAINTDVGEGFGVWGPSDEGELLDQVTAANVACGFHAGDPDILRRTCADCVARGVAIGAQVSYRDLAGFGVTDPAVAAERAVWMAETGTVVSVSGGVVRIAPDPGRITALCVHSDTPGAVALAAATREALTAAGIATAVPGAVS
ncbi:LamB/YcsF family protein [Actinomadura sp. NPDC047616]|uniref:LamB/YcsF family protein n=1 Tax=Actinomadura sp. NPDC047616 TaxID=3155914 RepID=UPI0033C9B4BE